MIIPWFQDNISEKSAVMKKSFKTSCPSPYISFVKIKSGMPKFIIKYTKNEGKLAKIRTMELNGMFTVEMAYIVPFILMIFFSEHYGNILLS